MPKYVVSKVHDEVRDWTGKGGAMKSYRIDLADEAGQTVGERIELPQKATTAVPSVGDLLEGDIEQREYEAGGEKRTDHKFKKASAYGGGGGGGGGRKYTPRPDDAPEVYASRQAMIARQHSQDVGMRILELAQSSGDDVATIMDRLGINYAKDEQTLSVLDAVARDVNLAGFRAWTLETGEERDSVKAALARIA